MKMHFLEGFHLKLEFFGRAQKLYLVDLERITTFDYNLIFML